MMAESPNAYIFNYDDKYQFMESTWGSALNFSNTPATFTTTAFNKEKIKHPSTEVPGYDANRNITYLERTDYFSISLLLFFYILGFGVQESDGSKTIEGLHAGLILVLIYLFFVSSEYLFSATIGHKIFQLRIVSIVSKKAKLIQILKRRFCDIFDLYLTVGFLALILSTSTKRHQRLGDLWAKTIVDRNIDDYSDFLKTQSIQSD